MAPVLTGRRNGEIGGHQIGHAVEQVVLVGHVVVQRHGLHPEALPQPSHRQSREAVLVGQRHGFVQYAGTGEGEALRLVAVGHQRAPFQLMA